MEELLKELEEAKQKIAEIEKKIEEKKAETGRWKPKINEEYWYLNGHGIPLKSIWGDNTQDVERYAIGNCYQTKEGCKFIKEKLKVIAELKEYEEPKNRAWDGIISHYYIYYDYNKERIDISYNDYYKSGKIYFESAEKAKQAIDAIGEERVAKYLLGVDLNE